MPAFRAASPLPPGPPCTNAVRICTNSFNINTNLVRMPPFRAASPLPPGLPVRMLYEFVRTPLISVRILCECPPSRPLPLSLPAPLYECWGAQNVNYKKKRFSAKLQKTTFFRKKRRFLKKQRFFVKNNVFSEKTAFYFFFEKTTFWIKKLAQNNVFRQFWRLQVRRTGRAARKAASARRTENGARRAENRRHYIQHVQHMRHMQHMQHVQHLQHPQHMPHIQHMQHVQHIQHIPAECIAFLRSWPIELQDVFLSRILFKMPLKRRFRKGPVTKSV